MTKEMRVIVVNNIAALTAISLADLHGAPAWRGGLFGLLIGWGFNWGFGGLIDLVTDWVRSRDNKRIDAHIRARAKVTKCACGGYWIEENGWPKHFNFSPVPKADRN